MVDVKYENQGMWKVTLQKFIEFIINKYPHIQLYTSTQADNSLIKNNNIKVMR